MRQAGKPEAFRTSGGRAEEDGSRVDATGRTLKGEIKPQSDSDPEKGHICRFRNATLSGSQCLVDLNRGRCPPAIACHAFGVKRSACRTPIADVQYILQLTYRRQQGKVGIEPSPAYSALSSSGIFQIT
jgi:hypothetical protein